MIRLQRAARDDLPDFCAMAAQPHAQRFVGQQPLEELNLWFDNPCVAFLRIENDDATLLGYFILLDEPDNDSVEFARIVIDSRYPGTGQAAIGLMEGYCRDTLSAGRIWLDVWEDNPRAMHVYEKLGYRPFKTETRDGGRQLHFYEKSLR